MDIQLPVTNLATNVYVIQVTRTRAHWESVEAPLSYDPEIRTSAQHGCRRAHCTTHWTRVLGEPERVKVEITVETDRIVRELAAKAAGNTSGRARQGRTHARVVKR